MPKFPEYYLGYVSQLGKMHIVLPDRSTYCKLKDASPRFIGTFTTRCIEDHLAELCNRCRIAVIIDRLTI